MIARLRATSRAWIIPLFQSPALLEFVCQRFSFVLELKVTLATLFMVPMYELIERAANLLAQARYGVALTGAGVSTPSGIPDFRSENTGLWASYDPLQVATLYAFRHHPDRFFDWIRPLAQRLFAAQPNAAHRALAQLQAAQRVQTIITQNIDNLHQRAGAQHVIELHGTAYTGTCINCYRVYPSDKFCVEWIESQTIPRCAECGGIVKPNVILFGEALPVKALMAAKQAVTRCDVLLIAGSSLEVAPASDLPRLAQAREAKLIMVNRGRTYLDDDCDVLIHEDVAEVLPAIAAACLQHQSRSAGSLQPANHEETQL